MATKTTHAAYMTVVRPLTESDPLARSREFVAHQSALVEAGFEVAHARIEEYQEDETFD